jgi:F-box protein 11
VHAYAAATIHGNKISKCRMEGVELLPRSTAVMSTNDIFQNHWGVSVKDGAAPQLNHNGIHHNEHVGVFNEGGRGGLHEKEIFSNGREGVIIKRGGAPVLNRNTIRENAKAGVFVEDDGQGIIEDNDIHGNRESGVAIGIGGAPTVLRNRIHDNNGYGVWCADNAAGTVTGNDLARNAFGARHPKEDEPHPSTTLFKDNTD